MAINFNIILWFVLLLHILLLALYQKNYFIAKSISIQKYWTALINTKCKPNLNIQKEKKLFTKIHFKYLFSYSFNNNIRINIELYGRAFESMKKTDNNIRYSIEDAFDDIDYLQSSALDIIKNERIEIMKQLSLTFNNKLDENVQCCFWYGIHQCISFQIWSQYNTSDLGMWKNEKYLFVFHFFTPYNSRHFFFDQLTKFAP